MSDGELVSLNCENCQAGIAGVERRGALEYMFYHAITSSHDTGWEDEIAQLNVDDQLVERIEL